MKQVRRYYTLCYLVVTNNENSNAKCNMKDSDEISSIKHEITRSRSQPSNR